MSERQNPPRPKRRRPAEEKAGRGRAQKKATSPQAHFYDDVFSEQELKDIGQQLASAQGELQMEVAVMRVMIRRVLAHIGVDDPAKALPLVRQGVEAVCRALRAQRVLSGEASESLTAAFATALREMGEELGVGDE
jgi:hypothetical protein